MGQGGLRRAEDGPPQADRRRTGKPPERRPSRSAPNRSSELPALYRSLGEAVKRLHGWNVVLLSGNQLLDSRMGLKPKISHRLWNGPIEARLLVYRVP